MGFPFLSLIFYISWLDLDKRLADLLKMRNIVDLLGVSPRWSIALAHFAIAVCKVASPALCWRIFPSHILSFGAGLVFCFPSEKSRRDVSEGVLDEGLRCKEMWEGVTGCAFSDWATHPYRTVQIKYPLFVGKRRQFSLPQNLQRNHWTVDSRVCSISTGQQLNTRNIWRFNALSAGKIYVRSH